MNHLYYSSDNKEGDSDYEYSTESENEYEEKDDSQEFQCKNMDPALAKLMGIIIEEQKFKTDWKPPSKSGLGNSEKIIPFNADMKDDDVFEIIKDDIIKYKRLSDKQLDYIKTLDSDKKFELIEIYNRFHRK